MNVELINTKGVLRDYGLNLEKLRKKRKKKEKKI